MTGVQTCALPILQIGQQLTGLHGDQATRLAGLQAGLKCGTNCGSCLPELKRMVSTAVVASLIPSLIK